MKKWASIIAGSIVVLILFLVVGAIQSCSEAKIQAFKEYFGVGYPKTAKEMASARLSITNKLLELHQSLEKKRRSKNTLSERLDIKPTSAQDTAHYLEIMDKYTVESEGVKKAYKKFEAACESANDAGFYSEAVAMGCVFGDGSPF